MKTANILTTVLLFSSSFLLLRAQEKPLSVEIRGGANFTKMHSDYQEDGKPGYRFDVVVDRNLSSDIFVRSGLTFSAMNSDFATDGFGDFNADGNNDYLLIVSQVRARYLQLPLMIGSRYKLKNVQLNGALGGYLSYGVAGNSHSLLVLVSNFGPLTSGDFGTGISGTTASSLSITEHDSKTFKDVYKRLDSGLVFSIGAEFKRFTLNGTYEFGLANIGRDGDNIKNRTISVSVGYRIF